MNAFILTVVQSCDLDIYLWVVSELWRNGGELADSQAILRAQKMAGKRGGPM